MEATKITEGIKLEHNCSEVKDVSPQFAALLHNVKIFPHMPDSIKSLEMCQYAVSAIPEYIKYVPDSMKTVDMCYKMLEGHNGNVRSLDWVLDWKNAAWLIKFVPSKFLSKEFYLKALKRNPYIFEFFPEDLKTAENCKNALRYFEKEQISRTPDINLICFLPDRLKTPEILSEFLTEFKDLPGTVTNLEFCEYCVNNNIFIPNSLSLSGECFAYLLSCDYKRYFHHFVQNNFNESTLYKLSDSVSEDFWIYAFNYLLQNLSLSLKIRYVFQAMPDCYLNKNFYKKLCASFENDSSKISTLWANCDEERLELLLHKKVKTNDFSKPWWKFWK